MIENAIGFDIEWYFTLTEKGQDKPFYISPTTRNSKVKRRKLVCHRIHDKIIIKLF